MEERLFYVEALKRGDETVELLGDEFHHLKKVVRLKPGSVAKLFNGKGLMAEGEVLSIGASGATLRIKSFFDSSANESALKLTLLQGFLKGDKSELIVQKATELGVKSVAFFNAEHSVVRLAGEQASAKLKRLKRVALEASKQCGRSVLLEIDLKADLEAAICASADASVKIFFSEVEGERGLKDLISGHESGFSAGSVVLVVGPEGGFSTEEVALAVESDFTPVRIGPRRLRAETAAIAAMSLLQYEAGDLGE